MNKRKKEIIVSLDTIYLFIPYVNEHHIITNSYVDTIKAINDDNIESITTTQLWALDFYYAERLFVVYKGNRHEIFLGDGDASGCGTSIRLVNNISKMIMSGWFEWVEEKFPTGIAPDKIIIKSNGKDLVKELKDDDRYWH